MSLGSLSCARLFIAPVDCACLLAACVCDLGVTDTFNFFSMISTGVYVRGMVVTVGLDRYERY